MLRIWLIVGMAAFVFTSLATAVPKMFLPQETFDFGFAPQDSKISHVFWVKSVGDDMLKILKVTPG
jgi:hypothetical protein